jgi:predicted Zn-dependent protease
LRGVVLAARAGYDPFSQPNLLMSMDNLNLESEELK